MVKTAMPWVTRQTLIGLTAGVLLGAAAFLLAPADVPVRALLAVALATASYLAGVAAASRTRLASATRYILRLRGELRGTQDHIMAHSSFRSLGAYLEHVAARIRMPLGALQTDARALAANPVLDDTGRATAARIDAHAEALRGALGRLADFALPDPARAPFNINNLLRESIDLCRHRAEERRIRIDEHYGIVPPVFGPAGRMHSAILNVVVNAIEAMPNSGGVITIETAHEADRVVARVRDSGIGIRPEHIGRVCDPFFTTKPDRASVGLGLWETRRSLEAVGAEMSLRSTPHEGTEVTLTFPQAAPMSPGRDGGRSSEDLPRNTADEGDRRIA